jgi:hypothetical protein
MARKLKFKTNKTTSPSGWDHEQALADALAERSRFLEQYPQYTEFQSEIDKMLDKAGSSDNRIAVLAMLIEGKLIEMSREFNKISAILLRIAA